MKKVLRVFLVIILVIIATVAIVYTVMKDSENNNAEEKKTQVSLNEKNNTTENNLDNNEVVPENNNEALENNNLITDENKEVSNTENKELAKDANEESNNEAKKEENKKEDVKKVDSYAKTEKKDYSKYESSIKDLIDAEENKKVLGDLKSGENNLIYKNSDGSYYEYIFENDKIVNIYYYVECGNKSVAQYMLASYVTEQMKPIYSEAQIYKESAIKAKLSGKMIETYSNYTKESLKEKMKEANNKLM